MRGRREGGRKQGKEGGKTLEGKKKMMEKKNKGQKEETLWPEE